MKKFLTLTAAVVLWGTASFAAINAVEISKAYMAAGYANVAVQRSTGGWMVTATLNGATHHFFVDAKTGRSVEDNGAASNGDDRDGDVDGTGPDNDGNGDDDRNGTSHDSGRDDNGGNDNDDNGGNDND